MVKLKLRDIAELCGGTMLCGDPAKEVRALSTDSRTLRKGDLFLALKGERYDGHDYAEAALKKGAACVIGESSRLRDIAGRNNRSTCLIEVGDTLAALHLLAQRYRAKFDIPIVAVTGSCGKTTTKDMLAEILSRSRKTLKTTGNLNNLIGAPLMALRLDSKTRAAVIEIASNAPGEIGRLAQIVSPTAGIITNIGPVHLEGLGSIEGVFKEKTSLVPHIASDGFLVVHEEDVPVERVRPMFGGKIVTFGLRDSAQFHATDVRQDIRKGAKFLLNNQHSMRIPVSGIHNVLNALGAIAAATELGATIDDIRGGLVAFAPAGMRMEVHSYRGATIVNDAYNANPRAMRESISAIAAMPAKRRILVLGDMLELGEYAREAHRSLGQYVAQNKADALYVRGNFSFDVRDGALEGGMQAAQVYCCTDAAEIANSLRAILRRGDVVLVKGSRGMHMEDVVQLISREE